MKCSKGGKGRNRLIEVKFRREDAKSFDKEFLVELKTDGGIASRRSVEVPWTVGFDTPTKRLRLGVLKHP
jgi:hypothetical protein